jgi:hypothetical protein
VSPVVNPIAQLQGVEDALLLLGRLDESDRRWILEHLPPAAKARLAGTVGSDDLNSRLAMADAEHLVEILHAEPAWLVHAVMSAAEWPWKAEVIERLPATLRMEAASLARRGVTLAKPAVELLLRTVSERIGSQAAKGRELPFDSFVSNFARGIDR